MGKKLIGRTPICFFLAMVLAFNWTMAVSPTLAQGPGDAPLIEKSVAPPAEEKKEAAPTTCGPLISDTCLPIEEHHANLQVLGALSLYTANFTPGWRTVSMKGNFYTFNMPVKFTYGPVKNLETYIIVPFIYNWVNHVDRGAAGINGERSASYAGIGDITAVAKYLLLEEGDIHPAVTAVGGVGFPSGHASHLNPRFPGQWDAIGTGSFNFITGVNLFKWVKPFLLYSNIWLNTPVNIFPLKPTDFSNNARSLEYVTFNLAAEYPLNKKWILLLEMYSFWNWSNIYTPIGFQTPTALLGFLPGIEYIATENWSLSAGCAFDTIGKFPSSRTIVPQFTVYYNF